MPPELGSDDKAPKNRNISHTIGPTFAKTVSRTAERGGVTLFWGSRRIWKMLSSPAKVESKREMSLPSEARTVRQRASIMASRVVRPMRVWVGHFGVARDDVVWDRYFLVALGIDCVSVSAVSAVWDVSRVKILISTITPLHIESRINGHKKGNTTRLQQPSEFP